MKLTLPTDSNARKDVPVLSGCMNYFPAALAWIARISLKGDRKHNPENQGPPFHSRGKSMDHGDCIVRHTMDIEDLKAAIAREPLVNGEAKQVAALLEEAAYRAWRSCAELQELCEKYDGAPLAPAARLPELTARESMDLTVAGQLQIGSQLQNAGVAYATVERDIDYHGNLASGQVAPTLSSIDSSLETSEREAKSVRAMRDRLGLSY